MKLPYFIQKWIRKQFDGKKVCDRCLAQYSWQTATGEMLCDKCHRDFCNTIQQQTRA